MLDYKQSVFSTLESRRNTEMVSSRTDKHEFKYDINDYLPDDCDYKPSSFIGFGRKQQLSTYTFKTSRIDQPQNQIDNVYKQFVTNLQASIKQKDNQIEKLKKQSQDNTKMLQETINKINKQLQQVTKKYQQLQKQNSSLNQKSKSLQENIDNLQKQKALIVSQLNNIKDIINKKTKNIRIFCQKYQLKIEPKIKQTYTIQIQTQTYQQQKTQIEKTNIEDFNITYKRQDFNEIQSSRKISCSQRPQFYQLYQKKQQSNDQIDLNNQFTTRSYVFGGSGLKPKKPAIIENCSEVFVDKQNDRRKINQRIEGRAEFKQKSKDKIKIKNQDIQLYPIDQSNIEDIVQGILALK